MITWSFLALLGAGLGLLVARGTFRRKGQDAAALASGLAPVADLTHLPPSFQRTALWAMCDGGFERRVVHGVLTRDAHDLDVTAFDLETLRERRGEWAFLPLDVPFRIAGVVSIVVCEIDRAFPHVLLKRAGHGDALQGDNLIDRGSHVAKAVRTGFGMKQSYPAELPPTLAPDALAVELPDEWRAYGERALVDELLAAGFTQTLAQAARRDLVIELIEGLVIVYPAAREVVGSDAFADLTAIALAITDGILASSRALSPRGVEVMRPDPEPAAH